MHKSHFLPLYTSPPSVFYFCVSKIRFSQFELLLHRFGEEKLRCLLKKL
eukprot:06013.XXX_15133_15279_1 [CDS] Oithona nana genome sequencing.